MTTVLSKEASEQFRDDIMKLRFSENVTPEFKAIYTLLQMQVSAIIRDNFGVINNDLIPLFCENLKVIAKDPAMIDTIEESLQKRFDRYSRNRSANGPAGYNR